MIRELGVGGMGTVYLVRRADRQFDQQAALKILSTELKGGRAVSRFLAERQILAALSHPGIARFLDGGLSADGRPNFVMDYVDGGPIDTYSDERQLDLPARLQLVLAVCDAVQYAHQNLIVHRDLKPGNFLVTPNGTPKLLNFGVAEILDAQRLPEWGVQTQPRLRTTRHRSSIPGP